MRPFLLCCFLLVVAALLLAVWAAPGQTRAGDESGCAYPPYPGYTGCGHAGDFTPTPVPTLTPVPGCDQFMPIDATSAQVRFVVDTRLLWGPSEDATTPVMVEAGKTAWMIGQADGYAQVVWACSLVWVPLDHLAPNPPE